MYDEELSARVADGGQRINIIPRTGKVTWVAHLICDVVHDRKKGD